jgi:hypothetical protein
MIKVLLLLSVCLLGCHSSSPQVKTIGKDSASSDTSQNAILIAKEKASTLKFHDSLGNLVSTIYIKVTVADSISKDGYLPYIGMEYPEKEIPFLLDKNEKVIDENKVTLIIDYPLNHPYKGELRSNNGFTRLSLIKEISQIYHQIYIEEETTATVKTLPMSKRKIYNRNETNGTYGIWGHDLGDLVLSDIQVYRNSAGQITITLEMES